MKNRALNKWRSGEPSLGIWSNLPDVHLAEMVARSGVDWVCFDLQHGLMDYNHLLHLLPAVTGFPITPIVRVASNHGDQIGKALDAGAEGVIVPMINTVDEAQSAVEACRYPPAGRRSCGPMRPAMLHGMEYLAKANGEIACLAMIETEEGLRNVDAIAAVKGLDGLFIGPMDLCYGLGLEPGDFNSACFKDAIEAIVTACRANKIAVGMFGYSPAMAGEMLDKGIDFVSAGTDIAFFREGVARALATAQGQNADDAKGRSGY